MPGRMSIPGCYIYRRDMLSLSSFARNDNQALLQSYSWAVVHAVLVKGTQRNFHLPQPATNRVSPVKMMSSSPSDLQR